MRIDEQTLQQITVDVCQSMLGLELNPLSPLVDTAHQLVASVKIRGCTLTTVEVFADDDLMARIAEVMFSSERGSLTDAEIRDAFGEIANMIGGNVKGSFGEEANLSLPEIGHAQACKEPVPKDRIRTTFGCCGYPLTIVVTEYACDFAEV